LRGGGYERALRDEFTSEARKLVRKDGTVVHTLLRAVPWTGSDGETVGTRALFVDITDRQQRRQQADILNRLLRHNLRNDMTIILGHAALLAEDLDDEHAQSAEQILETVRRWQRLVEKVQRIRRLLADDHNWTRSDLGNALERIESDLASAHPDATIRVIRPPEGVGTIRPEIELALTELCENAIRHADVDAPEVVVTASVPDDPWVELTVTDTGPAIPDNELVPLREAETTPLLHGTGIGLWMVRLAAEQVGGEVIVRENDEGGTVITIRYPTE
jgi:signal transduction histidine kinase